MDRRDWRSEERQPLSIHRRPLLCRANLRLGTRADRRLGTGIAARAVYVGRRGDAGVRAVLAVGYLWLRVRARGVAMEFHAALALFSFRRALDGWPVDYRA